MKAEELNKYATKNIGREIKYNQLTDGLKLSVLYAVIESFESQLKEEREKIQQYAEFCIESDRRNMKILDFESWMNLTSNPK